MKSILYFLIVAVGLLLFVPEHSYAQAKKSKKATTTKKKSDSEYVPDDADYVPDDAYVPDDVPESNKLSTKPKSTTSRPGSTGAAKTGSQVITQQAKDTSDIPDPDAPMDDVVSKKLTETKLVLPYEPLHERDIFWQRRIWRVIDCRQKMNKPFMYDGQELFTILKRGVESGELKSYTTDNFFHKQSSESIQQQLVKSDTTEVYNPDTGGYDLVATTNNFDPQTINQYRVKEDWYFDSESSVMKVRILGIAPMIVEVDNVTLTEYPPRPLFWIYFPDARKYLSKFKVFNEDNIASPISWDDLFEMRKFDSYIIKRSNVNNFRLQDYPELAENNIDRLIEGEKVKEEIFNFEHDLWSY